MRTLDVLSGFMARRGTADEEHTRPLGAQAISFGVQTIDKVLRQVHDICEFTEDSDCLLRVSRKANTHPVVLVDGTHVGKGDDLVELHLWNEHLPPFPPNGPTIAWAAHVERLLGHSLGLLAREVRSRFEYGDARALHAITPLGSRGMRRKVVRLAQHLGFEAADINCQCWQSRAHQAMSNLLIAGLAWAYNPDSFDRAKISREYVELWMSIDVLIARYGK